MIEYSHCPICNSEQIEKVFPTKDYTVSNENFDVFTCNNCIHLFTQNVPSQHDIGKYYQSENYISHSDTQAGLINKLYHFIRKRTLVGKKKIVQNETEVTKGTILDVGCGTGAFLHTMQLANWHCTGLEPDDMARKKALELYKIKSLPSHEIFNLQPNTYDAITLWHVLEHVHQLHEYVEQLKNILKPHGKVFIAVPNYISYDAQHYNAFWAAYDVPRHLYHFSPTSMKNLVEQHGLKIEKILPMWFDSFYVSMLSEKYKNGKGNVVKALIIGVISNLKAVINKNKCSSLIYVIEKV